MKIDLIHPPVYVNPKALTSLRPSPPLGLAYVAAALERDGNTVRVIDALAEAPDQTFPEGRVMRLGLSVDEIVARIDPNADMVGVTNMWSFSWPVVRHLLREIKRARPSVALVCGGEHFNGLPELSMQQAPIDYVVRGEGEETAVALTRALAAGSFDASQIAGLVWRRGDEIVRNASRSRIEAVDGIAWPAWHLFDIEAYNRNDMKTGLDFGAMVPMLATRGCPYSCTYCSSPRMWTTKWYTRSPELVVDEVEHYVERYGARSFPFQDLTTIVKRDWIVDFCGTILKRKLDIRWQLPSGTRCEVVDDEVASLLWESGCRSFAYAPESASDETRKLIKKKMKKESLFSAVDAAVKQNINLTCFIVLGFPHDKDANLRENLPFVRELARRGVEDIACGFFFPIPATELYDQLVDRGRINHDDESLLAPILSHDRYLTKSRNFCDNVPAWRLTLYRLLVLLNFYPIALLSHPRRVLRTLRNVFAGREESKLDSFLRNYLKYWRFRLRRLVRADADEVDAKAA